MQHILKKFEAFIIDMDGVLWHGDNPQPGLKVFFETLRRNHKKFILATNNASHTSAQYLSKLAHFGIQIDINQIITSGMATASYLSERYDPALTRIFVVGEAGLEQPLLDAGFKLTEIYQVQDHNRADIVVCGKDETLTWHKLATATLNINAGAEFYATNADSTLPTERGVILGNGAILAALETATGVKPMVIGKPEPVMYQQALKVLGSSADRTLAIGDRLETDILGAHRAGLKSILVLSGISSQSDLERIDYAPTWIMQDIIAITEAMH
ncbi:MAG: haloacid dehalogenase [Methylobacter sp.]|nr:MAG: haloacid dehalogenase [Methylobacter sp.]